MTTEAVEKKIKVKIYTLIHVRVYKIRIIIMVIQMFLFSP